MAEKSKGIKPATYNDREPRVKLSSQRIATVRWLGPKSASGRGKAQVNRSVVLLVRPYG